MSGDTDPDDLHICSLIVLVNPTLLAGVRSYLSELCGVEIYGEDPHGKLIVVLEADSETRVLQTIDAINHIAGVFNTALIHHHCEPAAALREEISYECKPT